jgi:outer membrane protein TolC
MHRALPCRRFPGAIVALAVACSASLVFGVASAQQPPVRQPAAPVVPPTAPGAPLAPPPPGASALPNVEINDAMLAPVGPATRTLGSWQQALTFINQRSTDIAIAMQEVERADGNVRVALAAALPTLTGQLAATGQLVTGKIPGVPPSPLPVIGGGGGIALFPGTPATTVPAANPIILAQLAASVPIVAPRSWYAIRTAELGITSNKLALEDKKRTIFTGVASAIIGVFTAERTADINRNGLKSALSVAELTKRQQRLGTATRLDVVRADQSAATARGTLVSGDESLRQARESLGLALGFHDAFGVPQNISLDEIESTLKNICKASPLEDRADIKKLHNDLEIARRGVNDVWLQFSPTVTVSSTGSLQNTEQLTSGHIGAWNIVGLLSVPFWEGGARYGNLRIARANQEEAKQTLDAAVRSASIQVTQALRGVSVAEQERDVSESARDLGKELFKLTVQSYQLGTATSFDLVNTEQIWRAAELDLVVKEFNLVQAKLTAVLAKSNCTY